MLYYCQIYKIIKKNVIQMKRNEQTNICKYIIYVSYGIKKKYSKLNLISIFVLKILSLFFKHFLNIFCIFLSFYAEYAKRIIKNCCGIWRGIFLIL